MVKFYEPDMVALLETRISSSLAGRIMNNSKLSKIMAVEANGFAGEIWLMWDPQAVSIEGIAQYDQILNVLVTPPHGRVLLLSTVYASPIPWIIAGDVNQALDGSDKMGGRPINRMQVERLQSMVDDC